MVSLPLSDVYISDQNDDIGSYRNLFTALVSIAALVESLSSHMIVLPHHVDLQSWVEERLHLPNHIWARLARPQSELTGLPPGAVGEPSESGLKPVTALISKLAGRSLSLLVF